MLKLLASSSKTMEMKLMTLCGVAVLVSILALLVPQGGAQDTSCLKHLVPCLNYLNGTRHPPSSCCDPLKSVIKSNPKCLCTLISNKAANRAEKAGIDVSKAEELPGRCGVRVNPIACLTSSPGSKDSVQNSASFNGAGVIMVLSLAAQILQAF